MGPCVSGGRSSPGACSPPRGLRCRAEAHPHRHEPPPRGDGAGVVSQDRPYLRPGVTVVLGGRCLRKVQVFGKLATAECLSNPLWVLPYFLEEWLDHIDRNSIRKSRRDRNSIGKSGRDLLGEYLLSE